MTPSTTILKETAALCKGIRVSLVQVARNLHEISSRELWKAEYGSYAEYLEAECQISQGFASKLTGVFSHFVLEGGLSQRKLEGVDSEKLYLAMRLPMKPEEQLMRAQTWTRGELKAELASGGGEECSHENTVEICSRCHSRV